MQSYQTRGGDLTVEEPKGDNEEVILLRVHPHLKHTKTKHIITENVKTIIYYTNKYKLSK